MSVSNQNLHSASSLRPPHGLWADRRILLLLLVFTFCLVVVAGRDSWLRMTVRYVDSYWFQMCGKAWMSGLSPYVDFTDSKGPLLWLIYGIGYLISPHTLYGVCLIEILCYWITFYVLYKAALTVLKDSPRSLLASMAMGAVYFYPGMHFEMLTEDYCHLFFSLAFYILLQAFFRRHVNVRYAVWLGIACASTLMIKYSYFIVLMVPSGLLLIQVYLLKKGIGKYILNYIAGFLIVVLPFVIYFLLTGILESFINEYFINTLKTIFEAKEIIESDQEGWLNKWPFNIWYLYRRDHFLSEYMRLSLVCLLVTVYRFRRCRSFVFSLLIWYGACLLLYATISQIRYYNSMAIFFFGGILWLAGLFHTLKTDGAVMGGALVISFIAVILTFYVYSEFYFIKVNYRINPIFEKVSGVINVLELQLGRAPTITFLETSDYGETMQTNALPGTKYWARQFGMTSEMLRHHWEDINVNRPDLVVVDENCPEGRKRLEDYGYRLVMVYHDEKIHSDKPPLPRYLYINGDL